MHITQHQRHRVAYAVISPIGPCLSIRGVESYTRQSYFGLVTPLVAGKAGSPATREIYNQAYTH